MFANIIGFIVGVIALIGAGVFSYFQLSQHAVLPTTEAPKSEVVVVQKKEAPTTVAKTPVKPPAEVSVAPKQETPKAAPVPAPVPTNGSLVPHTVAPETKVIAPEPLRITTPAPSTSTQLSVHGVIEYTNGARSKYAGLPALIENQTLDRDAQIKLDDMFSKQYFEHESPTGVGPGDIAKAVGYDFILVGENLALGDFENDEKLVLAWMNSPGHRANILNTHYQEIGVAVGKGMYEGRLTWLAVQSFGMPLSACPAIDAQKRAQIDANNTQISAWGADLDTKKARINATPTDDPNYNTYVNEFNALIPTYNALVADTRTLVAEYNVTVQAFNSCIAAAGTATH